MPLLNVSERESDILGIRVGRGRLDELNPEALVAEIRERKLDLCKIQLPLTDPELFVKLSKLELPHVVSDLLLNYEVDFKRYQPQKLRQSATVFEEFTRRNHDDALGAFVLDAFSGGYGAYFSNPALHEVRPVAFSDLRARAFRDWIVNFDNSDSPQLQTLTRRVWLATIQGRLAGFLAAEFQGEDGELVLAQVGREFRQGGIYLDIVRFIQNYCYETKVLRGRTQSKIQDLAVSRFLIREGMELVGYSLAVQINAFLSNHSSHSPNRAVSPER